MDKKHYDELWYSYLTGEHRTPMPLSFRLVIGAEQKLFSRLPAAPHCVACGIPMAGVGGWLLRIGGSKPSSFSSRLCSRCERLARKQESGAEVKLSLLFADVRDSTPLAESSTMSEFSEIIQKFYRETSDVLVEHNAMVNRLMGDQVSALFVPRFAGKDHARVALHAAQELLRVTGHGTDKVPWIPVGVGIHTGKAFVGAVGSANGVNEIAVLGSAANVCARLSSRAAAGEILISDDSVKSGNLAVEGLESRSLELKGVSEPVPVRMMSV